LHHQDSALTILFNQLTHLHVSDYFVILVFIMITSLLVFWLATRRLSDEKPGWFQQILELAVETVGKFLDDIIGHDGRKYMPLIGTFTILILCSNLIGAIPGFMPPTGNLIVTLSLAVLSFLAYNFFGFKEQGIGYLKHFTGPVAWLAFLFVPIEIVSHLARPMSLGVRLFGNVSGDHAVGGVFLNLVPPLVPIPLLLLGLFVAFVQTLVFILLSMIYIAMAVEHH
jgi:F-type H+-transporting ATPase subunit a